MSLRNRWLLVGMLVVGMAACGGWGVPAQASGWNACGKRGVVCRRVSVPLDWSGETPGRLALHVVEYKPKGPSRGVMFLLAGGPGQASSEFFDVGEYGTWSLLFPGYTLVTFDPRGSGDSDPLSCPAVDAAARSHLPASTIAARCAGQLGARRDFFGTSDNVEDIDAVRQALGFTEIGLYGASYGTDLALAYARTFPDHVRRLLLDSVATPLTGLSTVAGVVGAIPPTLSRYCAQVCATIAPAYSRQVVVLANSLAHKPLRAGVLETNGRPHTVVLTAVGFFGLVLETDIDPGLAAELPAAVEAARNGDPQPLLRLDYLVSHGGVGVSAPLYLATTCDDGPMPWSADTPLAQRPALLRSALAQVPAASLGGFGSWALRYGNASLCLGWPVSTVEQQAATGPYPDVPLLAISGSLDLRSPTFEARALLSQFPQGHLLTVANAGHAALADGPSPCLLAAVRSWLHGQPVRASCSAPRLLAPVAAFPSRSAESRSTAKTLALVQDTLHEAAATWLLTLAEDGAGTAPGLDGGRLTVNGGFELSHYRLAGGVALSGNIVPDWLPGQLAVRLAGVIHVEVAGRPTSTLIVSNNTLSGALDDENVVAGRLTPPAAQPKRAGSTWSLWEPRPASVAATTKAIAGHVAAEYRLDAAGARLVNVSDGPPRSPNDANRPLSTVNVLSFTHGKADALHTYTAASTWTYKLCGRGPLCSLPGTPTKTRGRLVRREALELALDTFAFAPAISAVVVYLPPAVGTLPTSALYFERSQLGNELRQPLTKTLRRGMPPLPWDEDASEARKIDALTLSRMYSYIVTQLGDGTASLQLFAFP